MSPDATTHHSKKIRSLVRKGAAFLVAGIVLYWAAEPLSTVSMSRDESAQPLAQTEFCNDAAILGANSLEVVYLANARWEILPNGPERDNEQWVADTAGGGERTEKKSTGE